MVAFGSAVAVGGFDPGGCGSPAFLFFSISQSTTVRSGSGCFLPAVVVLRPEDPDLSQLRSAAALGNRRDPLPGVLGLCFHGSLPSFGPGPDFGFCSLPISEDQDSHGRSLSLFGLPESITKRSGKGIHGGTKGFLAEPPSLSLRRCREAPIHPGRMRDPIHFSGNTVRSRPALCGMEGSVVNCA